jgi:hypothetical protein
MKNWGCNIKPRGRGESVLYGTWRQALVYTDTRSTRNLKALPIARRGIINRTQAAKIPLTGTTSQTAIVKNCWVWTRVALTTAQGLHRATQRASCHETWLRNQFMNAKKKRFPLSNEKGNEFYYPNAVTFLGQLTGLALCTIVAHLQRQS